MTPFRGRVASHHRHGPTHLTSRSMVCIAARTLWTSPIPRRTFTIMSDAPQPASLEPAILDRLRCPLTRSRLRQDGEFLVAELGGLRYPIREGFPVLLIEEAKLPPPFKTLDEFKAHHRAAIPK